MKGHPDRMRWILRKAARDGLALHHHELQGGARRQHLPLSKACRSTAPMLRQHLRNKQQPESFRMATFSGARILPPHQNRELLRPRDKEALQDREAVEAPPVQEQVKTAAAPRAEELPERARSRHLI